MTAALILTVGWLAGSLAPQVKPAPDPSVIRVYVHTADGGEASELRERRESVKDLVSWLAGKKKDLVVVDNEDRADVVLEVEQRWVTTPAVVVAVSGSRPGQPSMPAAAPPSRVVHLRVELTYRDQSLELTNKSSPLEASRGWKAAADDVAKQAHKWMMDRRTAILGAR